ncbi:MAG: hypothetical protein NC123_14420 [Butyrivibrio sp.]|nr:hypothetical protein [Acetatifactor muris]MCM1560717.1 hypothetical protein [Butyrivibrio sp.]
MSKFDRKLKELSKNIEVPKSYDEKVDKVLLDIMKRDEAVLQKKSGRLLPRLAVCLILIICAISLYTIDAHAHIFSFFKESILDFLGRGSGEDNIEDMGVESEKLSVSSKPDLKMELQEKVIDSHSIYLLVQMAAPSDIRFGENVAFDYYCFCRGTNYSTEQLLGGSISCELVEVSEEAPNLATYMVSLVFDETLEEGSKVTVFFEDLAKDLYTESQELLIDGVWSITFDYYPTVTEHIEVEGTPEMEFAFVNTTANLMNLEISPFGLVLQADVSKFPADELGVTDTNIAIRLVMIDGSELTVVTHDPDVRGYVQGGSTSFSNEEDRTYEQVNLEFTNMINLAKIVGIYIEDLYLPLK